MQYVLLIYQGTTPLPGTDRWNSLPEDEQKRIYAAYGELSNTPGVTPGLPLGLPAQARTVRVNNGSVQVSDGPFVDHRGAMGGYFIFEADDLDAAVKQAARIPAARLGGAVEVRPVGAYW